MKMGGSYPTRNLLNVWLLWLVNSLGMGGEICRITEDAVKKLTEGEIKLRECIKEMKMKKQRNNAELKAFKDTLVGIERLRKEWKQKDRFSASLLRKMKAANEMYFDYVSENSYYKPTPRVLKTRQ